MGKECGVEESEDNDVTVVIKGCRLQAQKLAAAARARGANGEIKVDFTVSGADPGRPMDKILCSGWRKRVLCVVVYRCYNISIGSRPCHCHYEAQTVLVEPQPGVVLLCAVAALELHRV
jgi:hypothetical protein